jgi:hypothetical protein
VREKRKRRGIKKRKKEVLKKRKRGIKKKKDRKEKKRRKGTGKELVQSQQESREVEYLFLHFKLGPRLNRDFCRFFRRGVSIVVIMVVVIIIVVIF